jgi:hypothetical protein
MAQLGGLSFELPFAVVTVKAIAVGGRGVSSKLEAWNIKPGIIISW